MFYLVCFCDLLWSDRETV